MIWRRYVDDAMVAICEDLIEEFTDQINQMHPAVKFAREEESEQEIPMLDRRIKEHHHSSSPVGHHFHEHQHPFSEQDVSALQQETDWFQRGVAEASHIANVQPNLNRDRGRHILLPIYREIINTESHDHYVTNGSCDNNNAPNS